MMNGYIQKKCPTCGAILTIKNQAGLQNTTVTCPVCHQVHPFARMKDVLPTGATQGVTPTGSTSPGAGGFEGRQQPTGGPGGNMGFGQNSQGGEGTKYRIPGQDQNMPGELYDVLTHQPFSLNMGPNIVGRRSNTSNAHIQIDTRGSKKMSRQHLLINVRTDPMGNIIHECSLYKPNCNDTFINGIRLRYGDRIILKNGCDIKMPDALLRFVTKVPETPGYRY